MSSGKNWYVVDWSGETADPGYDLREADIPSIAAKLPGAPVAVEHEGVRLAMEAGAVSREAIQKQQKGFNVGRVVSASGTTAVIEIDDKFKHTSSLVDGGYLTGVSLTHARNEDGTVEPLELSLTSDPARTKAKVKYQLLPASIKEPRLYPSKPSTMEAANTAVPETQAVPEPAAAAPEKTEAEIMAEAIEALPEGLREKLTEKIMGNAEQMKKLQQQLESSNAALQSQATDADVLKRKFQDLVASITAEDPDCGASLGTLSGTLDNSSLHGYNLSKMIHVCNAFMMSRSKPAVPEQAPVTAAPVSRKRKIEEAEAPAPTSARATSLRDALSMSFL